MREINFRCIMRETVFCFAYAFVIFLTCTNANAGSSQSSLLLSSSLKKYAASDASMQQSSISGMVAMMNLADLNIPGAVASGYQAYGQYRNAANLNQEADQTYLSANSMKTGSDPSYHQPETIGSTPTSYGNIGTDYLYHGEADAIAREFEKRSGLSRTDFHNFMVKIGNINPNLSVDQTIAAGISRFQEMADKIPNEEFRKNLEKGIAALPTGQSRDSLIAKAINGAGALVASVANVFSTETKEEPSPTPELASINSATPALVDASKFPPAKDGVHLSSLGREPASSPLWTIMSDALAKKYEDETIFRRVSLRYEQLATKLLVNTTK